MGLDLAKLVPKPDRNWAFTFGIIDEQPSHMIAHREHSTFFKDYLASYANSKRLMWKTVPVL